MAQNKTVIVLEIIAFILLAVIAYTYFSQVELPDVDFSESPQENQEQDTHQITRIVDGDTAYIEIDGVEEKVRLIGINSPEINHPSKGAECFGIEAKEYAQEFFENKYVRYELDPTQSERDVHGRLLAYLVDEDGNDFGYTMVSEGYAYEYTYDNPYKNQGIYKQAQQDAEEKGRGLWKSGTCS